MRADPLPVSLAVHMLQWFVASSRPVVAFDYDGTLIDAFEAKREPYWRAVAETLGLEPADYGVVDASYARTSGANRFDQLRPAA